MIRAALAVVLLACCALPGAAQQAPPDAPPVATSPAPLKDGDAFGEAVTLPERAIVFRTGAGTWKTAQKTLADAFKTLLQQMEKAEIKPAGAPLTIYEGADDTGFRFRAAYPVSEPPKTPPETMHSGVTPSGKALKFMHRGTYAALDTTYEALTNHLEGLGIEAQKMFIEQYDGGAVTEQDTPLTVEIYVFPK